MLDKIFGSGLPESPEPEPQKLFDRDATSTLEVVGPRGSKATVTIHVFSAMTGWEVKRQMRKWIIAENAEFCGEFTRLALSHAFVNGKPLDSDKAIDEALVEWQNVRDVFKAVMDFNGIDTSGTEEVTFDVMGVVRSAVDAAMVRFEQLVTNGAKE